MLKIASYINHVSKVCGRTSTEKHYIFESDDKYAAIGADDDKSQAIRAQASAQRAPTFEVERR